MEKGEIPPARFGVYLYNERKGLHYYYEKEITCLHCPALINKFY